MAKRTFENALTKLDRITAELEQGDLSLDNSLKKFDEGVQLVKFCNEKLEEARSQGDMLLKKNDTLVAVPFTENSKCSGKTLSRRTSGISA